MACARAGQNKLKKYGAFLLRTRNMSLFSSRTTHRRQLGVSQSSADAEQGPRARGYKSAPGDRAGFLHLPPSLSDCRIANMSVNERTYIMIKPDGVQRGLVGKIIQRFEERGFKLVAMKLVHASVEHLEKHYGDLAGKPFFPGLVKYMASGPVVAMVWQGLDAVKTGRSMLGATNPLASAPGSIRGDFALAVGRNICHGSDSVENAEKEIKLWFPEGTIQYTNVNEQWIFE
ncbi:nucleoside diphosphate kinase [Schizophyllum commune]